MKALLQIRLLLLVTSVFVVSAYAEENITVDIITDKLNYPWSVAFLPDNEFLVTEKPGQLKIVSADGEVSPVISGLPEIAVVGQGGLLDVVLHPDFINNRWIYLSFVAGSAGKGYSTEVIRGKLVGNQLKNVEKIFVALPKTRGGRHFGSRLLFDKKNYLYISLGDRGLRSPAQDLSTHTGSIIRLHDDGRIPADNPFVKQQEAKAEIFSYGHRNVQGMALNEETGEVWVHEHGPQGGDELNRIQKGKNYGWPVITYGVNYVFGTRIGEGTHKQGMEQPEYFWDPSIAPSGMAFYRGTWLIGALKFQLLAQLVPAEKGFMEKRFLEKQYGRIRDVRVHPKTGVLYLLTDANRGQLLELTF